MKTLLLGTNKKNKNGDIFIMILATSSQMNYTQFSRFFRSSPLDKLVAKIFFLLFSPKFK